MSVVVLLFVVNRCIATGGKQETEVIMSAEVEGGAYAEWDHHPRP